MGRNRPIIIVLVSALLVALLALLAGCVSIDTQSCNGVETTSYTETYPYDCKYCGAEVSDAINASFHGQGTCTQAAPCGVSGHYVLKKIGNITALDINGESHAQCPICKGSLCTGEHGEGICAEETAAPESTPTTNPQQEAKSSDATLKSLSLTAINKNNTQILFTAPFNADTCDYTAAGAFCEGDEIAVAAEANHEKATVKGEGNYTLSAGDNALTVTVTAEDGAAKKTYKVILNAEVPPSDDCWLRTFNITFQDNTTLDMRDAGARKTISVEDMTSATVTAVASDNKAEVSGDYGAISIAEGENTYKVYVKAESGKTAAFIYKITMTVTPPPSEEPAPPPELSSDAALKSLALTVPDVGVWSMNPSFSPDVYKYSAECGEGAIEITGVANHAGATVSGNGIFKLVPGDNTLNITVTAEDGITTKVYTVVIHS